MPAGKGYQSAQSAPGNSHEQATSRVAGEKVKEVSSTPVAKEASKHDGFHGAGSVKETG